MQLDSNQLTELNCKVPQLYHDIMKLLSTFQEISSANSVVFGRSTKLLPRSSNNPLPCCLK